MKDEGIELSNTPAFSASPKVIVTSVGNVVVAWQEETQLDRDISLSEIDIDNLIRAKAAIYSGCMTLLPFVVFIHQQATYRSSKCKFHSSSLHFPPCDTCIFDQTVSMHSEHCIYACVCPRLRGKTN